MRYNFRAWFCDCRLSRSRDRQILGRVIVSGNERNLGACRQILQFSEMVSGLPIEIPIVDLDDRQNGTVGELSGDFHRLAE